MKNINVLYSSNKKRVLWVRPIVLLGLIMTIVEYYFDIFNGHNTTTTFYIVQMLLIWGLSYYDTVKRLGWLHVFSLIQFTTFVFITATPFFSLFVSGDLIRIALTPDVTVFSEPVLQHVMLIFSAYFATSYLVYFSLNEKRESVHFFENIQTREDYYNAGHIAMLIGLPVSLYVGAFFLFNVDRNLIHELGSNRGAVGLPFWARVLDTITLAGYYLVVASMPSYKRFVKYTLLMVLVQIPNLLFGERGESLMVILFFFWYRYKIYGKGVKFVYLAVVGLLGISVSYIVQNARLGDSVGTTSLFGMVYGFFEGSSTTTKLTSFYVEYRDHIPHRYPFFLDQLIAGMFGFMGIGEEYSGQSLHTLEGRSSLGHNLVYEINPNYYLSGASMGTSWATEWYEFGLVGVIVGACLLAWAVKLFDSYLLRNRYWSIFTYMAFSLLVLSPRGNIFLGIYDIIKYTVFCGVIYYFINAFKRKGKSVS